MTDVALEDLATGWNDTAQRHRASDPERWALCHEFATLHIGALNEIGRRVSNGGTFSDEAVLQLAVHAMNLYTTLVGLVARGQFDVASYLYRGLGDAGGLIYSCGLHEELAERWQTGKLLASTARKQVIADLEASNASDVAEFLKGRLLDDFGAMNQLAHAAKLHADKLVRREGGALTPMVGGHYDEQQYADMMLGVLDQEYWFLTFIGAARRSWLPESWRDRFSLARATYSTLLEPLADEA